MIQTLCVQSNKRCKDREQEEEAARKGSLGSERSWRVCPAERGAERFRLREVRRAGSKTEGARCARGEWGPSVWWGTHRKNGGERRLPASEGLWNI